MQGASGVVFYGGPGQECVECQRGHAVSLTMRSSAVRYRYLGEWLHVMWSDLGGETLPTFPRNFTPTRGVGLADVALAVLLTAILSFQSIADIASSASHVFLKAVSVQPFVMREMPLPTASTAPRIAILFPKISILGEHRSSSRLVSR